MMLESIEGLREYIREHYNMGSYAYDEIMSHVQATEREIAERYMPLPVDRKGEAWRIGDKFPFADESGKKHVCTVSGIGNGEVFFYYDQHADSTKHRHIKASGIVHDKPRTVEDVLREYGDAVDRLGQANVDMSAYADEIRELLGGDAE